MTELHGTALADSKAGDAPMTKRWPCIVVAMLCVLGALRPADLWAGQGWYYVVPPRDRMPPDLNTNLKKWPATSFSEVATNLMKELPLSEWVVYSAFDTAKECEAEKDSRVQNNKRQFELLRKEGPKDSESISRHIQLGMAFSDEMNYWGIGRCVASDDPRLRPVDPRGLKGK